MTRAPFPHRAWIALGANLGARRDTLERAVATLSANPRISVERVSNYIETEPVGGPPGQPRFLNGALELRTDFSARGLLALLLALELELGRDRSSPGRDLPRAIDLDVLLYDDAVIAEPDMIVPHPRMHQRGFVLRPLAEIAPDAQHPVLKKSIAELLASLDA